ncbi:glycine cleavage system protein GcvH [Streptomyces sp. NPDC057287]|uniref:glycine cleavage system protein GcvH n=1 Tax=Streptomyces sp. NPDC057287 TaxID=3346086 RepID=UPI00362B2881
MTSVPSDLRYTTDHQWVRHQEDGRVCTGLTDHGQRQLGDIVNVELPEVGATYEASAAIGKVETRGAVSAVYAPVAGEVAAVNDSLSESPEDLNDNPYGAWIVELTASEIDLPGLLSAPEYEAYIRA